MTINGCKIVNRGCEMKKIFIFILVFSAVGLFAQDNANFKTIYDDVEDVTTVIHKDLEYNMGWYNIKESLSGERENIQLYINNDALILKAIYQFSSWAFVEKLTFLNDNGSRCVIKISQHNREVLSGKAVREYLYSALTESETAALKEVLSGSNPVVVYSGTKARTDKLKIKPKVLNAMIETIAYFESMK